MASLRDAVRRNNQEVWSVAWQITITPALGPTLADDVGRTPVTTGASVSKISTHRSMRVFPVSCLKHTLIVKAFEDEERSK